MMRVPLPTVNMSRPGRMASLALAYPETDLEGDSDGIAIIDEEEDGAPAVSRKRKATASPAGSEVEEITPRPAKGSKKNKGKKAANKESKNHNRAAKQESTESPQEIVDKINKYKRTKSTSDKQAEYGPARLATAAEIADALVPRHKTFEECIFIAQPCM